MANGVFMMSSCHSANISDGVWVDDHWAEGQKPHWLMRHDHRDVFTVYHSWQYSSALTIIMSNGPDKT